jgi:signal transduction histidine kinase/CheY-like chemotaxis protein
MLVEDRGVPALEPQAAPRAASLLLHCLAVALLVCIAAGATLYLYWAFNDVVSSHRRHMNAAAYDAQQFFDQREALLRSLSASAVRNVGSAHLDEALAHTGAAPQVEVLPLQEADGAYDWALVLTRRDLHRVALARTKVVYSSPRQASTLRMAARDQVALAPIPADTQAWLSRTLANITLRPSSTGQTRIIWLHPPQDTDKRLFLFTPLDPVEPEAGWIGLEVQGVESAVDTPQAGAGNYVLFDERNRPVLHSPDPAADRALAHTARKDAFGLQGQGWIPDYLVLSKSVGDDGWRLVYYTPLLRVLQDNAFALQTAAIASLLLTFAVVLQIRYIRRHLVLPAVRQYETLAGDLSSLRRAEQSLLQAKRDAEAANQAKTVFLTTMSHEIRTPLYGILGTLELFSLTPVSPQQAQYLETVQQSSATLLRTINDTLDLSRIEAGHTALQCAPFSPVELLNSVVASFAARAQAKGLQTYALADPDIPVAVIGDAMRIRQILDNLVSNAVKFTDSGRIVLRLKLAGSSHEGICLGFQVADTGAGIAPEHQISLFDPYYQVATDDPAALPGTGLGLSICRRLAEAMQGRINAVSELGLGTSVTFDVRLPQASVPPEATGPDLSGTAVYVQGAVPEIVHNLCGWLRHWGAVALPYPLAGTVSLDAAVLVRAWPHTDRRGDWHGPQVIIHPPGLPAPVEGSPRTWFANAYSLASIRQAVHEAHIGLARTMPHQAKAATEALNLRVLVAEDNPISQFILREQLEHLGCTVVLAGDGQEALNLPGLLDFDAVLTDLNMPLVDGYEFTRRLRKRGYEGPILGITANAFEDEQRRGKNAGMTRLLVKPLALSAMRQALQALQGIRS